MRSKKILFVFGTRPEAIKLAPLIQKLNKEEDFVVKICVTAQHRIMLDQVLRFFSIVPDYDLNIMQENQSLFYITTEALIKIENVLDVFQPDLVIVQGDTSTTLVASLAAFYKKIKVAHVEAGLRSFNKFSPFPEEMNRVLTSRLTDFHFAPTQRAMKNLLKEGIKENIWVVGNTAIDALFLTLNLIERSKNNFERSYFGFLNPNKKIILVTTHRRENFGEPLFNICSALKEIVRKFDNVEVVFPVHPNPNVKDTVYSLLSKENGIKLIPPLEYPYFTWLMKKAYIILTDSGGIQEEAPSLGKPVLVLRNVTERVEGIEAGTAKLVGTDKNKILEAVEELLLDREAYDKMSKAVNPYGDGKASFRIYKILREEIFNS